MRDRRRPRITSTWPGALRRCLAVLAAVVLCAWPGSDPFPTAAARAQVPSHRETAEARVQVLTAEMQALEAQLADLDARIEPLEREIERLLAELAQAPPPAEEPPPEDSDDAPTQVEFRPPLERRTYKTEAVTLVLQDQRAVIVDFAAINEAVQPEAEKIDREFQAGTATQWHGTWFVSSGAFNVKYDIDLGGVVPSASILLVRKDGTHGETAAAIERAGSAARQAIEEANPETHIVQFAVYPDCFDLFRTLRRLAWERGLECNWVFFAPGEGIPVGPGGGGLGVK